MYKLKIMPKFKKPRTLEDLAIRTLDTMVWEASSNAIVNRNFSSAEINVTGLRDYLYANLPDVMCNKLSTHILSNVIESLSNDNEEPNENYMAILGIICQHISILDLVSDLPTYAYNIFTSNLKMFEKLRTLIVSTPLPRDVVETLHLGFNELKFLVNFQMHRECCDEIIKALGMCSKTIEHIEVEGSRKVTNWSFETLKECPKLKHILICCTSMTDEGYDEFLQYKKSEDTAKCLLRLSVGSPMKWAVSSRQLNEIASACPMLKLLDISEIHGDMENLLSLTALEVLKVRVFDFQECNLDGFLRSKGSNLLSLELAQAKNSEVDLMCIMEHCPNIKELIVIDCGTMDMNWGNVEKAAKAFENLEVLDVSCEFSPSSIERMLHACVNLKRLRLNPFREEINDEFIQRLLSRNSLQKLTTFCVDSDYWSMTTVNALIQQCPLLEKLDDLDEWSAVAYRQPKYTL